MLSAWTILKILSWPSCYVDSFSNVSFVMPIFGFHKYFLNVLVLFYMRICLKINDTGAIVKDILLILYSNCLLFLFSKNTRTSIGSKTIGAKPVSII